MHIGLQTWGSDGDIRPFIALAGGLSEAGHDVTLAITSVENKNYTHLSEALKFKIQHIGTFNYTIEELNRIGPKIVRERNPLKQLNSITSFMFDPVTEKMYEASKQLCKDNDMVIGHFMVYPLGIAAEKEDKLYISVSLSSATIPSRYTTPVLMPNLGKFMNSVWWKIGEVMINSFSKSTINMMRKREGLPPLKRILGEATESKTLNLIASSYLLCPPQPDWENHHRVCGFFNIPYEGERWQIPESLDIFLNSGPPPIYMTFGSMMSFDPAIHEITHLMVDAVRLADCRAIIQSHWDDISDIPENPLIYKISSAPHQYIFPHCSAVVHHGGAGTTQSSTLSGCPSVVVAHIADQPFWGRELHRLGVAPKPLHRRSVTAKKLSEKIKTVLASAAIKEKAQRISEIMKREDGVRRAVQLIENLSQETHRLLR